MRREKGPVECLRSFDRNTPEHYTFERPLVCIKGEEVIVETELVDSLRLFLYARVVKEGDTGGEHVIAILHNPLNTADPKDVKRGDKTIYYSFEWKIE